MTAAENQVPQKKSMLDLRNLADIYEQTQKVRIAAENRVRAVAQGADDEVKSAIASDRVVASLTTAEKYAEADMGVVFESHPLFTFMLGIPGVKNITACRVLGMIEDPRRFPNFGHLRTFSGLTPGKNKLVKGKKACFSSRLKKNLYIVFESMLKAAATTRNNKPTRFYAEIYRNWREIYKQRHGAGDCKKKKSGKDEEGNSYTSPDEEAKQWSDLRQHYAAKNKLLDVFLFHIYEQWLIELGAPVPDLYVHKVLGHHTKFDRMEFTSPEMAKKKMGIKVWRSLHES